MKKLLSLMFMAAMVFGSFTSVEAKGTKTIRVKVSKDGYTPSSVDIKKGEKVRLIFKRIDTQNCGGEVVIKSLNIRKTLPLNKNVTIEFTPTEAGEITFSCGMGMMKGKLIVQ